MSAVRIHPKCLQHRPPVPALPWLAIFHPIIVIPNPKLCSPSGSSGQEPVPRPARSRRQAACSFFRVWMAENMPEDGHDTIGPWACMVGERHSILNRHAWPVASSGHAVMPLSQAEPAEHSLPWWGLLPCPTRGSALVQTIPMASLLQAAVARPGVVSARQVLGQGDLANRALCCWRSRDRGGCTGLVPVQPSHGTGAACPGAGISPAEMVLGTINHHVLGATATGSAWVLASPRGWHA